MRWLVVMWSMALLAGLSQAQEAPKKASRPTVGGTVVEMDQDGLLYVNASGVQAGMVLELYKPGEPIKVGDEVVGHKEGPFVGTAVVVRVQNEKLCVAKTEKLEAGKTVAKGDLAYVRAEPGTKAPEAVTTPGPIPDGTRSAVDALLGGPVDLDYIEAAAKRQYEKVLREDQRVEWTLPSGDLARVEEPGRIVIASQRSMLERGQYERLDNGLAEVVDLVGSVVADFPILDRIATRYLQSRYYAEQAGVLHRLQMSWGKDQPATPATLALKVPDCRLIEGEALSFADTQGGATVDLKGARILKSPPKGKLGRAAIPVEALTFGEHALLVRVPNWFGKSQTNCLVEVVLVTEPTEGRFTVIGDGADQVKGQANLLIEELQ